MYETLFAVWRLIYLMSSMLRVLLLLAALSPLTGCIHVKMDPIEVRAVVDVNVKVDRELDSFFGDLDKKSAAIESETSNK